MAGRVELHRGPEPVEGVAGGDGGLGRALQAEWEKGYTAWRQREPERAHLLDRLQRRALPEGWISGRYLAFQLMTDKVFAEPSARCVSTSGAMACAALLAACTTTGGLAPTAPDLPTPRLGHRESPSPFLTYDTEYISPSVSPSSSLMAVVPALAV